MTEALQTPTKEAPAKDEKASEYPKCEKCGEELNSSPYGANKQAVVEMASDHASKRGCDWAAKNLDKVWQLSEPAMKKHEAEVKANSEKEEARLKKEKEEKEKKEKAAATPPSKKDEDNKKSESDSKASSGQSTASDKR